MEQLLSILLALVALSVYGQKATVESVAADPLNIAAAKYPMTDLNGNKAPLVVDGLPAGTHNVTITANGTLIALDGSLAPTFAQD